MFPEKYKNPTLIGSGAEGDVWRADTPDHSPVAIKRYKGQHPGAFHREVLTLTALTQENVVRLIDFFRDDETCYLVQEFCAGGTLKDALEQPFDWTLRDALELGRQLASAVEAIHGAGFVHGDIKPANILRQKRTGTPLWKLTDFGVAQIGPTATAQRGFTPRYAAPEILNGETTSIQSDIFALCETLTEPLDRLETIPRNEVPILAEWKKAIDQGLMLDPVLRPSATHLRITARELLARLNTVRYVHGDAPAQPLDFDTIVETAS